jgi:hypothetical protein
MVLCAQSARVLIFIAGMQEEDQRQVALIAFGMGYLNL